MTELANPAIYEAAVPHAEFARLREEDPVHWTAEPDGPGFWSVLRHDDIVEISRQPLLYS